MSTRLAMTLALLVAACGDDDSTCDLVANTGCEANQACEAVDGTPTCVASVVVVGRVFDLQSNAAIAGARIVALDANGAAASFVATSDADGSYELPIPIARNSAGEPAENFKITLRADASGFLTFPSGIRPALAFDTGSAVLMDDRYVITSSVTDIGLLQLVGGPATGTIEGTVADNDTNAGVLVVAEVDGVGYTAAPGNDGKFAIFNVPAGSATVQAYARGHNYVAATTDVVAGATSDVTLDVSDVAASTVSGSVQIVNGGAGTGTSVILVVESTFRDAIARGETPPGLRAPDSAAPSVDGAFTITGVPAGRYVVLAAFENDNLVRDESSIGGTAIVRQDVVGGQDVEIAESFKVTGALDIIGPGASSPEMVTGTPTFQWVDDSSEDGYAVTVFDSFGTIVWETAFPSESGSDVTLQYGGPALQSGVYYQFRVASIKDPSEVISRSEDLKGVFFLP